jgi:hypothetical protein
MCDATSATVQFVCRSLLWHALAMKHVLIFPMRISFDRGVLKAVKTSGAHENPHQVADGVNAAAEEIDSLLTKICDTVG